MDEDKEARKLQKARMVLAGQPFTDDDDPFEGLTPQVSWTPPSGGLSHPCMQVYLRSDSSLL